MIVSGPSRRRPSEIDFLLDNDPNTADNTNTITRLGDLVSNETWVNDLTLKTIKTTDYVRTLGLVTSEVVKVYAADGLTVIGQKTVTYTRLSGQVTTIATTRDV